jgi:hypothetical protein
MISSGKSNDSRSLCFYEEAIGILKELETKEGVLFAKISNVSLAIPLEVEEKMRPHIGKRVGLLCTDIPGKHYLLRVIPDQEMNSEGGI